MNQVIENDFFEKVQLDLLMVLSKLLMNEIIFN